MDETRKISQQICPQCYMETDIVIDSSDQDRLLGPYSCQHCGKEFTLLEAAEAKSYQNSKYHRPQTKDRPKKRLADKVITSILLILIPVIFTVVEMLSTQEGPFGEFAQTISSYTSDLFIKILMGNDINTSTSVALIRIGIFSAVVMTVLYFIVKIFKLDRILSIRIK